MIVVVRTVYETIRGKVYWAKVKIPNKFGRWSIDVYPDEESTEKIKKLKEAPGIKNAWKQNEDGKYMTFSRDTQKIMRGKMVLFDPPIIYNDKDQPADIAIGNGSDCDVVLQTYSWAGSASIAPGRGARLHAVKVWNLVPYDVRKDYTEQELVSVRGLLEQPPMPQW